MASAPLNWLLKIGADALETTASTISAAINELNTNSFRKDDTAESTLDDDDYIPFYDDSATAKRKALWSTIQSTLKTYFDTLYNKITVSIAYDGTASGSATRSQKLTIDGTATEIHGTKYMELTQDISTADGHIFTFNNAAITASSMIDWATSDFDIKPENISSNTGTCVVTVEQASSSKNLTVRIYIK